MALVSNGTFKGILIGDHCSVTTIYVRDIQSRKIPRANGTILRNTGGGRQELSVRAWVIKDTRQEIEEYCEALSISFGNTPGTLIINNVTYTDCYFIGMSPSDNDNHWNNFSLNFIRNPY